MAEIISPKTPAEIRSDFKRRYGRLVAHYLRWKSPQPNLEIDPKGHARWERNKNIMEHTLRLDGHSPYDECPRTFRIVPYELDYDEDRLWFILRRLAVPITTRLNVMVESQRRRNFVESPTNAKQTLKALRQIEERLTEKLEQEAGYSDPVIENLKAVRANGSGYLPDGTDRVYSQEDLEDLDRKIAELEQPSLVIDLCGPGVRKHLEEQKKRYINLLPPHYQERFQTSQDT